MGDHSADSDWKGDIARSVLREREMERNVAKKCEVVTCAGEVRWVPNHEVGPLQKLQQRFEVVEYEDGRIKGCRQEWRDVPIITTAQLS